MADAELRSLAESRLGRVLRGKYRLDRVLGIGGMAVVYAATHRNKKRFAIKMLHPELSIRENIRTRFLREGYVANTVDHPGAVAVLDDDVAEDGSAFIVMELLDGAPLDELAARYPGRKVPVGLVVSIGDALLDVLSAAHAKGIVHRDLKPVAYCAARVPREHYCLDTRIERSGPTCVGERGPDLVGKRGNRVPRLTEVGGRVTRVENVNFAGAIDDFESDFARSDVHRNDDGSVREILAYDRFGAMVSWEKWSDGGARVDYVDIDGQTPRAAFAGTSSYDGAGAPVVTTEGYASKKTTYDDRDQLVEEKLFDAHDQPIAGAEGWSVRRLRYDDFGNVVDEAFFDASHAPVAPKGKTFASRRDRFDERHWLAESSYFDASGAPTKGPDGAAFVRFKRDAYGRVMETAYFDGANVPTASNDGKMVVRPKYDDTGRLVEERLLDASGIPRAATDSCFGHATMYDPQGRATEESCLDAKDGAVTLSTDGWAIRRTIHDARGNAVDVSTYGADGALHVDKDGVARTKSRFDERNLVQESSFFDASDKPTNDKRGVSVTRFTYDDAGKKTGEQTFDECGKAVVPRATGKH